MDRRNAFILVGTAMLVLVAVSVASATSHSTVVIRNAETPGEAVTSGEYFSVTAQLENQGSQAVQVRKVKLLRREDNRIIDSKNFQGFVPGRNWSTDTSSNITLVGKLEEPGLHKLKITAQGMTQQGTTFQVEYPVTVKVKSVKKPEVMIEESSPVAASQNKFTVTIRNRMSDELRSIMVSSNSSDDTGAIPRISEFSNGSVEVSAMKPTAGKHTIMFTVEYMQGGVRKTIHINKTYNFEPLREKVKLKAGMGDSKKGIPNVTATLENSGNAPIHDVRLKIFGPGGNVLSSKFKGKIRSLESWTSSIDIPVTSRSRLLLEAKYMYGDGEANTTTTSLNYTPDYLDLSVSTLNVTNKPNKLIVEGKIENTGRYPVHGIVIDTVKTDDVQPEQPYSNYFVGTVLPRNSTRFNVSIKLTGLNVSSAPIVVSYRTGQQRFNSNYQLSLNKKRNRGGSGLGGNGQHGIPGQPVTAAVVVLLGVLLAVSRKRYR